MSNVIFKICGLLVVLSISSAVEAGVSFSKAKRSRVQGKPGSSSVKLNDTKASNKVDGNIDEEITNARMRADSGSKSKFSLSLGLSYTGASINKPLDGERPNLSGNPGQQRATSANVGTSVRYRWNKNNSATLGTSFGVMTPFQGDTDRRGSQFDVFDPTLGYSHVEKIGDFQTTAGISTSYGTSQSSRDTRYVTGLGLTASAMRAFGRLTVGSSIAYGFNYWGNEPGEPTGDPRTLSKDPNQYGGDTRTEWSVNIYPALEYQFNDTYAFRTVFGYFNWKHLYGDTENRWRLLQTYVYQSVGLGISVTRDVYLYPNIQFLPEDIRDDFTNVALSATINVF